MQRSSAAKSEPLGRTPPPVSQDPPPDMTDVYAGGGSADQIQADYELGRIQRGDAEAGEAP